MSDPKQLNLPPFPPLDWGDYNVWEGDIALDFGEAGLNVTPHNPEVTRQPSQAQADALTYLLQHQADVFEEVLKAVAVYYEQIRPAYAHALGADADNYMPVMQEPDGFRALIELCQVHIHPSTKAGIAYVGLQFRCTWDQEHGLGVLMHRDRVVDIGGADHSFAWAPEEADPTD